MKRTQMRNSFAKLTTLKNRNSILFLIFIAAVFRFWNLFGLQYWSGDEEWAIFLVRRMIHEGTIALISPNTTIEGSLGSFFHLFSVPLFIISNLDPTILFALMSGVGVITTLLMYWAGNLLFKNLGFIAAFLYASSFLAGLFDRRWWPLSWNQLLVTLSIIGLYKILVEKKYIYSVFVAIGIGFAGHADPSLAVIALATLICIVVFRPTIRNRGYLAGIAVFLIFLAPLALFELRHPGAVSQPFIKMISRVSGNKDVSSVHKSASNLDPGMFVLTLGRVLFSKPDDLAESNFCYCSEYNPPFLPLITSLLVLLLMFFPIYFLVKKDKRILGDRKSLLILYILLGSFVGGALVFWMAFKHTFPQHFFSIIFPVFFLLVAFTLRQLIKNDILLGLVLFAYMMLNFYSLTNSEFKYPLLDKQQLVNNLAAKIPNNDFSLYITGNAYFHNGGFTALFMLADKAPRKSYLYNYTDWMLRAHSLYAVEPTFSEQKKVVIVGPKNNKWTTNEHVIYKDSVGQLEGVILENEDLWFNEKDVETDSSYY